MGLIDLQMEQRGEKIQEKEREEARERIQLFSLIHH